MITKEQIMKGESKQTLKVLANGGFGTGKTYFGFTFPKVIYLGTEPNGLDTAKTNPELLKNLVWADEFIPSPHEDIKSVFERLDQAIMQAHDDAKSGKAETLVLDNLTFLSENRWMYIDKYEKTMSAKSGNEDKLSMYGNLSRWLYKFCLTKIMSFKGNVVATCHEKSESDEAMEKKADKSSPIISNILGGFRDQAGGMFSASIYLEKKRVLKGGKPEYQYLARCQPGNQRSAKNRYGLPEIVENISFESIIKALPTYKGELK